VAGGRRAYLGTFATCEEAALVYQRAKRRSDEGEYGVDAQPATYRTPPKQRKGELGAAVRGC